MAKQVRSKINNINKKLCRTLTWINHTGQKVLEDLNNSKVLFENKIGKIFLHYYNLKPIMNNSACMQVVYNSKDLGLLDFLLEAEAVKAMKTTITRICLNLTT
jgi:hypothetical protein